MTKIIHFTTVHPRTDTRLRVKEATALAAGFDQTVFLYVQDGLGDEHDPAVNVQIVDTGNPEKSITRRITIGAFRMFRAVLKARPTIAHFHDPELIPAGLLLKCFGIRVIYDVHENVPEQILSKTYLSPGTAKFVAAVATMVEWLAARVFDALVLAEPIHGQRFGRATQVVVQNFPVHGELMSAENIPYNDRPMNICYIGGVSRIRGMLETIRSLEFVKHSDKKLLLGGPIEQPELEAEAVLLSGWHQTTSYGRVSRIQVAEILAQSRVGLVTLHPVGNYLRSYPVKLFEYMICGLPVIVSDFPYWREILAGVDCAIFVDPLDPQAIGEAIQWIFDNPAEAEAMGKRGRQAVLEKFNWDSEGRKLVDLYTDILSRANIS